MLAIDLLSCSARSARLPPASSAARSCVRAPRLVSRNRRWPRIESRGCETRSAAHGLEQLLYAVCHLGEAARHLAGPARVHRLCERLVTTTGAEVDAVVMQRPCLLRRNILSCDVVDQRR